MIRLVDKEHFEWENKIAWCYQQDFGGRYIRHVVFAKNEDKARALAEQWFANQDDDRDLTDIPWYQWALSFIIATLILYGIIKYLFVYGQ